MGDQFFSLAIWPSHR